MNKYDKICKILADNYVIYIIFPMLCRSFARYLPFARDIIRPVDSMLYRCFLKEEIQENRTFAFSCKSTNFLFQVKYSLSILPEV